MAELCKSEAQTRASWASAGGVASVVRCVMQIGDYRFACGNTPPSSSPCGGCGRENSTVSPGSRLELPSHARFAGLRSRRGQTKTFYFRGKLFTSDPCPTTYQTQPYPARYLGRAPERLYWNGSGFSAYSIHVAERVFRSGAGRTRRDIGRRVIGSPGEGE